MKACGIHFMDNCLERCHFAREINTIQNGAFGARKGAGSFQDGDAAFKLLEHPVRDSFRLTR